MFQGAFLLEREGVVASGCFEGARSSHVKEVAVGQDQWYHFGVGAPPVLVYFSGDWDVH